MHLFLLRHSKSVSETYDLDDLNRPLSSRGINDARTLASFILKKKIKFNQVLCSSSIRTVQTLDVLKEYNYSNFENISITERLYLASEIIISKIVNNSDANSLLIIAHNPGISSLISILNNSKYQDYPTSTMAYFIINSSDNNSKEINTEFIIRPKNGKIVGDD